MIQADIVIAGAGFSGSVLARKLAEEQNKKVAIIERREHIAGNMFDKKNEHGIIVQQYGPHIFHTNDENVYSFVKKYGEWKEFILQCKTLIRDSFFVMPFNFEAIDKLYSKEKGATLKIKLKEHYRNQNKVTIVELLESDNPLFKEYAKLLCKEDYAPYTSKQWGISTEEIDVNVLKRVPIRLDYEDRYFDDKYQMMPVEGFTKFFEDLLNHPNIEIHTGKDIREFVSIDPKNRKLVYKNITPDIPFIYTGAVDELLNYQFGKLPYRSLKFEYIHKKIDSFQDVAVVAYPKIGDYTRITEYKKLPIQKIPNITTLAFEYPLQYVHGSKQEPYYPILSQESTAIYQKYLNESRNIEKLYLCGRLADFKYYNMDNAIAKALNLAKMIR